MNERTADEAAMDMRLEETLTGIKNKTMVISGKGGVGKSTVSVNLAYSLALRGHRVGILDVDIHGPNVAKMMGIDNEKVVSGPRGIEPVAVRDNLRAISLALMLEDPDTPVIWRGPLKMMTIKQFIADVNWGVLDHLIIDSPPGTGDEPLSVCQLIKEVDAAVIVTTPQEVSVLDSRKCVSFARQLNIPYVGIVENMSGYLCPKCGERVDIFGHGGGERAAFELSVPFLGRIPLEPDMVKAGDSGAPYIGDHGTSPVAGVMDEMIDKIYRNS